METDPALPSRVGTDATAREACADTAVSPECTRGARARPPPLRRPWPDPAGLCGLFRVSAQKTGYLTPRPIGGMLMPQHRIFTTEFSKVYPLYVQKAERKSRTKEEVDQIICWLTGYTQPELTKQIEQQSDFKTFFAQAPAIHPNVSLIKGVVCGVRVEDIKDPLMQRIRYLDKLIDELAKGRAMEKILRQ
jgi:hypothetical protein